MTMSSNFYLYQLNSVEMGIINITSISDIEYQMSKRTTKNLVDKIKNQNGSNANLEKAATNKKSLNLQLKFMMTFSKILA